MFTTVVMSSLLAVSLGDGERENPSPQPPPRSGEGEQAKNPSPQPPPRNGEGEQAKNPSPQPPPRNGEGEQDQPISSSPPLRCGEGVGGRGSPSDAEKIQLRTVSGRPLPENCVARLSLIIPEKGPSDYVGGETADGSFRLAIALDKEIQVWGWQRPQAQPPVFRLTGHDAKVVKLALSPDALTLASADENGNIVIWDLQTGKSRHLNEGVGTPVMLAVTDSGKQTAAAGAKGVVVWEQAQRIVLKGHKEPAVALALSRDAKQLATATAKGVIRVWTGAGFSKASELPWKALPNVAPKDAEKDLPFRALHAGQWDKVPKDYVHEFTRGVNKLVFSPDGKHLAAAGGTVVRLWQVPERKLAWEHNRHAFIVYDLAIHNSAPHPPYQGGRINDLAFAPDGKRLLSHGAWGRTFLVHVHNGQNVVEAAQKNVGLWRRNSTLEQQRACLTADGQHAITYGAYFHYAKNTHIQFAEHRLPEFQRLQAAGLPSAPQALAVSPDGKTVALANSGNDLLMVDLPSKKIVFRHKPAISSPTQLKWSPDGKFLLAGVSGTNSTTHLLRVAADRSGVEPVEPLQWQPYTLADFDPTHPARLLIVYNNWSSRNPIWLDCHSGKELGRVANITSSDTLAVAVLPGGRGVAFARGVSYAGNLVLCDATGKEIRKFGKGAWTQLAASPDGRVIASVERPRHEKPSFLSLWDVANGKRLVSVAADSGHVFALLFSPDRRVLASLGEDGIKLWEAATGRLLGKVPGPAPSRYNFAFTASGKRVLFLSTAGELFEVDITKQIAEARPLPNKLGASLAPGAITGAWAKRVPVPNGVAGVAYSPDGSLLALGGLRGTINLLDPKTGKIVRSLEGHKSRVLSLAFTADGKTLVSGAERYDKGGLLRVWEVATGKQLFADTTIGGMDVSKVAISPAGRVFAVDYQKIQSWDLPTGQNRKALPMPNSYTTDLALSRDGKLLLVSALGNDVRVWNLQENTERFHWQRDDQGRNLYADALALSPADDLAAVAWRDGRIRLWNTRTGANTGELVSTNKGGEGAYVLAFDRTGELLASVGSPSSGGVDAVCIWGVKARKELLRLEGLGPRIAWSPDGRYLATAEQSPHATGPHHVLIWDIAELLGRKSP